MLPRTPLIDRRGVGGGTTIPITQSTQKHKRIINSTVWVVIRSDSGTRTNWVEGGEGNGD